MRNTCKNGYSFSRVINGCWQLSSEHCLQGKLDYDDAIRAFHMLVDEGLTTFDCADIYTGAEELIGRFVMDVKGTGHYQEEDIQVHTKFVPDNDILPVINMKYTEGIVDRSLMRMHREALDLVQFHWWNYDVPGMLDTAFDLVRLQEKGKIRNIGMCNMDTEHLKMFVDAGINVCSNQAQYSMFDRRPEREMLDYCAANGIHAFCFGTLAGGFLAERYMGKKYEAPETRSQVKYMQIIEDSLGWEGMQALLPVLKDIADEHGVSVSSVAVRYILEQRGVGACMVGVRNSRHVKDNLNTLTFDMTEKDIETIRNFIAQYPTPEGDCYWLERNSARYKGIILTDRNDPKEDTVIRLK